MKTDKIAIYIKDLTKIYPGNKGKDTVVAVKHLNLKIKEGEIFALLGPNGAGKTTTIGTIIGTVLKTSGSIQVMGMDVVKDYKKTRSLIGVVPQELNFDPFVNVRKCMEYQSGMFGVPKSKWWIDEIMEELGLTVHMKKNVRQLSGGMKRRLLIAKALVHRPRILILDEPTAGVDVELRRSLWKYVKKLNREGTTVILTTHYLEEAEALADRIAIIDHGELKACDTLANLKAKYKKDRLENIYFELVHDEKND